MKKLIKILSVGLILILIFPFQSKAQNEATGKQPKKGFGISIAPSVLRLTSKPGQSQRATVRVLNNGETPTHVILEASDVGNQVDEKGKLVRTFPPAGTLPFSCAKWALLQETEFDLKGGEFKDSSFLISPPADATGGTACVVFFRGVPRIEKEASSNPTEALATIQIQPRLGAMVFHEIEGTVKRTGTLLSLAHEPPTATTPLRILYVFKNEGNADILITGTFYILDDNKTLMTKGDLKPVRTFPGDEGAAETEWDGSLAPGNYRLVVTFELGPGAQEVIVKELDFTIA